MGPANFFIIEKDADNRCIDCCENAPRLVGTTRERLIGILEKDIMPPETFAQILQLDNLAREHGTHKSTDHLFIKGQWYIYATTRTSTDGKQVTVCATDITEQQDPTGMLKGIDHVKRTITFPLSRYIASELELRILNYHLNGWKNKDIAEKLERTVKAIDKQLGNMRQRARDGYPGATLQEALTAAHVYHLLIARASWFMPPVIQNRKKTCKVTERMRKKVKKIVESREFPTDNSSPVR